MPTTSYLIDPEWGESLLGLRMAVPLSWWPGYSSDNICLGKITKFDPSARPPFVLKIGNNSSDFYGIQYDAVLKYA